MKKQDSPPSPKRFRHPWHTIALMAWFSIRVVWTVTLGIWMFASMAGDVPFDGGLYFLLMLPAALSGLGVYLLYVKSPWRVAPFLVLMPLYVWIGAHFTPAMVSLDRSVSISAYLGQIPRNYLLSAGLCAFASIYALFLTKHERMAAAKAA